MGTEELERVGLLKAPGTPMNSVMGAFLPPVEWDGPGMARLPVGVKALADHYAIETPKNSDLTASCPGFSMSPSITLTPPTMIA